MKKNSPTEKVKINFFSGLGRTLLVNFLILTLIPMLIISWFSYKNAINCLMFETERVLKTVAFLKTKEIEVYFKSMINDLKLQVEISSNIKFFEELEKYYKETGKSLDKVIKLKKWSNIVDEYSPYIKKFYKINNYYDIFFINKDGDILYSVAGEEDLGKNLLTGHLKTTSFSNAVKKSLDTGNFIFSDYERYKISGNKVFGFIVNPVLNKHGNKIGVIAFQFPIDKINNIMMEDNELGKRSETYIVGADITLRSKLLLDNKKKLIQDKIVTEQTKRIKQDINKKNTKQYQKEISKYIGPHNKAVLGIYHKIMIENIMFFVISEVEEKEAFKKIEKLEKTMLGIISITAILAVIFSLILVRKIIKPILFLSLGVKRVEAGDYSRFVPINLKNEIGDLAKSLNDMTIYLKKTTEKKALQDWFTRGKIEISNIMSEVSNRVDLANKIIEFFDSYLSSRIIAIYIVENDKLIKLSGNYFTSTNKKISDEYEFGKGIIGQAALEKKPTIMTKISEGASNLNYEILDNIIIYPFTKTGEVICVFELVIPEQILEKTIKFLDNLSEDIAISFKTFISHNLVQDLLEKSHTQKIEIEKKNLDLEKTKKELEKKAKDLEVSGKYKSEFLANMSHEFRTPLNSILLLSNHLALNKGGDLNEKQLECVETINSSGNELLNLINDVLDIAKIEAGHMKLEYYNITISDIIRDIERNFKPLAEKNNIDFKIILSKEIPEIIITDLQKLSQILKNLLSNAFKFTEKGSVTLEICRPDLERVKKYIVFKVIDTGLGISKENIDTVFQAFHQADGTISRNYGGTGLGLSISREYAKLFGGEILLESEEGKGSIFTLFIPENDIKQTSKNKKEQEKQDEFLSSDYTLHDRRIKRETHKSRHSNELIFKRKKILVVDDDMRNVFAIINILEEKKMITIVAKDGEEALKMLEENPDTNLVLTDIIMPKMDGYEAMKRIRKMDSIISKVPVIALTSKAMRGDKLKCINAGANAYLSKPVDTDKLLSTMKFWLNK